MNNRFQLKAGITYLALFRRIISVQAQTWMKMSTVSKNSMDCEKYKPVMISSPFHTLSRYSRSVQVFPSTLQ